MAPDQENIIQQQELLAAYRRTLAALLQQQAYLGGAAYAPPSVVNSILEARTNIQRIKAALRTVEIQVEDETNDAPSLPSQLSDSLIVSTGDGRMSDDKVAGDTVSGDKVLGNQTNVDTAGGDYAQGNIDKRQVVFDGSLQIPMIGNNAGSITINYSGDELFNRLAQAPLSRYIRIQQFKHIIDERTVDFVGREFIFAAIDNLLREPTFPSGYIIIHGEPGIGKTALISQLVKRFGYVHHFNVATQNIRSAQDFLANVCAQIIIRYDLDHSVLLPETLRDSGFLSQILSEAAQKKQGQQIVVLVDALDEAEDIDISSNSNRLCLPSTLPSGIFFVVTSREQSDYRLFVDRQRDIYLHDDDPQNLQDIRCYVYNFLQKHRTQLKPQLTQWGVGEDSFVEIITEKSQGNFMYLVYVLHDMRSGKLTTTMIDNIRNLPNGLREYYQRHWRAMRAADVERFEKYYQPVVCILAAVRESVTIAQIAEWTKLTPIRVHDVIREWHEFLNRDRSQQGDSRYRIYHASFQDFLEDEVGLRPYHNQIIQIALGKIKI